MALIKNKKVILKGEQATINFAKALANIVPRDIIAYLNGDLGAGKTTLVRGFLQGLGFKQEVRSPTYTLLESYEDLKIPVYHFDLYRLQQPEELEFIGIRDVLGKGGICFFEWAERGVGILPLADLRVNFLVKDADQREIYIEYNAKKISNL